MIKISSQITERAAAVKYFLRLDFFFEVQLIMYEMQNYTVEIKKIDYIKRTYHAITTLAIWK